MATADTTSNVRREGTRREVWAWSMYDWSSSAFSTLLITIVMLYTTRVVWCADSPAAVDTAAWLNGRLGGEISPTDLGETAYAWVIGGSMLLAAFLSPLVGAVADARAAKRRWLIWTAMLGAAAIALPGLLPHSFAWTFTILFFLSSLMFELSLGPYNGFLPEITTDETINRVSAQGFGLGYIGGALALVLALGVMLDRSVLPLPKADVLREDYNASADATFEVALPPDTYDVHVVLGDAARSRDQMQITLEDQAFGPLDSTADKFAEVDYSIGVRDGRLNVGLKDLGGSDPLATINALEIRSQTRGSEGARAVELLFDFGTYGSPAMGGYIWASRVDAFRAWDLKADGRMTPSKEGLASHPNQVSFGWTAGEVSGDDAVVPPRLRVGLFILGAWWALFSIPTLLFLRDAGVPGQRVGFLSAARGAVSKVGQTLRSVMVYRTLAIFLIGFLFYNDGMVTVINQASAFATSELGFGLFDLILLVLMVQVLALPGALVVGWLSDKIGQKRALIGTLLIWVGLLVAAWFVTTKLHFWIMAAVLSAVMGGTQSVARAMMGVMTPPQHTAEFFGFFNLSGKATSWMGNLVYGGIVLATHSARLAILSLLVFFFIGLSLSLFVNVERGKREAAAAG
ncbi:MAG: MFS transporter [Pirellulales bacterium]|nr:MFS transporter [Pirellulales bacterium]